MFDQILDSWVSGLALYRVQVCVGWLSDEAQRCFLKDVEIDRLLSIPSCSFGASLFETWLLLVLLCSSECWILDCRASGLVFYFVVGS